MSDDGTERRTVLRTVPLLTLGLGAGAVTGTGESSTPSAETTAGTLRSFEQVAKFVPDDGSAYDRIAGSVAMAGDGQTALVGARRAASGEGNSGEAHVLEQYDRQKSLWRRETTLTAPTVDEGAEFGTGVALATDGSTALVGAPKEDRDDGLDAGAAYRFVAGDGWDLETRLVADDGDTADLFGEAVALSVDGTVALVGASGEDLEGPTSGAVYVFTDGDEGPEQVARLTTDESTNSDLFGTAVAIAADGTTALVGAEGAPQPVCDGDSRCLSGAAYVFEEQDGSWEQTTRLAAPDAGVEDTFGESVALAANGTTALVGADNAEAAYLFTRSDDAWSHERTLTAPDPDDGDLFGCAVALSADGSRAFVGARQDHEFDGAQAGAVYVFEQTADGWRNQTALAAEDGNPGDYFGWSVATSADGTTTLAGARNDRNENGDDAGSAYVFDAIPTVSLSVSPSSSTVGEAVSVEATDTVSPNGDIAEYRWNLTDDEPTDTVTTTPAVEWTYYRTGLIELQVKVVDTAGKTATAADSVFVTLGEDRPPSLPDRDTVPRDLDGDGMYEDLDGDGEFSLADLRLYFSEIYTRRNSRYVQTNRQYFDVTGDGRISLRDLQELLESGSAPSGAADTE